MKVLRFDSIGGASGDMILASLVALGVDLDALKKQVSSLGIDAFDIVARPVTDGGLNGTQVTVSLPHHEHHPHRHLSDIRRLIEASGLSARTQALSLRIFERLAGSEARIHNTTPDEVHFHEVGAMDSIIDIVGSCVALEMLQVDAVSVGPLPCGCGSITCAHGVMPNPAPATVDLLKGHPLVQTDEPFELVTPTGAALLMAWKTPDVTGREIAIVKQAHGFGHRKLNSRPNLLRAILMETSDTGQAATDECLVLECNLDDTTPELVGSLTQRLLEQGALDAFTTSVQMKKQRPGMLLTVLCHADARDTLVDTIFRESTTFGIREHLTRRTMLDRRHVEVATPYGRVRLKIGSWKGKDITFAPEYEDCAQCARAANVSLRAVYEAAQSAPR